MRRTLLQSAAFTRAARRLVKRRAEIIPLLQATLEAMGQDVYQPSLKTHKLKGDLAGLLACSVGYDVRIVFEIVPHQDSEAILLQSVGSHDEVY